jgi:hypothetical protein
MRLSVIFFTTFGLLTGAFADQQPDSLWSRTWNSGFSDYLWGLQQTSDCGFIATGGYQIWVPVNPQDRLFLAKTDASGVATWSRYYGSGPGGGFGVCQTSDGGYAAAGYYGPGGTGPQFFLLRTNSNGDSLWSRSYGGPSEERCYALQQLSGGSLVLAGYTTSYGSNGDFWLLKAGPTGDSLWSKTYGGDGYECCYDMKKTSDGGFILAGESSSIAGDPDWWVVKTNSSGDTTWTRRFRSSLYETCQGVIQTGDGGYALVGWRANAGANSDAWIIKTNSNGDSVWGRGYGGPSNEDFRSVVQTSDGGYLLLGSTRSYGAGDEDLWLVRVDSDGDSLWSRTYGTSWREKGYTLIQTTSGGYATAGITGQTSDAWLLRLDYTRPRVSSVTDVGNDQGRQVRIRWLRSSYDFACPSAYTITDYGIYRRIDQYRQANAPRAHRATLDWPPGEWEYISTVPARGEQQYAAVVPTLADSTSAGIYWSVFFVSAETPSPLVYFDSTPDSGYSKDNLAPDEALVVAQFQVTPQGILLNWDAVETGDGQPEQGEVWYKVYGGTTAGFVCSPSTLLGTTQETHFLHDPGSSTRFYYAVRVSDDH